LRRREKEEELNPGMSLETKTQSTRDVSIIHLHRGPKEGKEINENRDITRLPGSNIGKKRERNSEQSKELQWGDCGS